MTFDPIVEAWHGLFRTADLAVLREALQAGAVPDPCVAANGNDLLFSVLCRSLTDQGSPALQFGAPLPIGRHDGWRLERRRELEALVDALLERADVAPFVSQAVPLSSPLSLEQSTAVDLALAWGLTRQALNLLQHPSAPHGPSLLAWNQNLEGQPGTPGRRSQLAVAIHRNQEDVVRWLISVGVPLNEPDMAGETPLFAVNREPMLKLLLGLGADLNAHTCKASLVEHWAQQMRGLASHDREVFQALVDTVTGRQGSTAASPVVHLQSKVLEVAESFSSDRLDAAADYWRDEWNNVLKSLPASLSPEDWARHQASGPWKGHVSALAQVGILLIEREQLSLVPALIDLQAFVQGPNPVLMRRGIPDRGVFALGAMRYFADQELFKKDSSGTFASAGHKAKARFIQGGVSALEQCFGQHPLSSWDAWMLEATLTLQRPQGWKFRQKISDMWVHRLQITQADGSMGFHAKMGLAEPRLELAHSLLQKGVRLVGSEWMAFCRGLLAGQTALPADRRQLFAQRWLEVTLSTFVDSMSAGAVQIGASGHLSFPPSGDRVGMLAVWKEMGPMMEVLGTPEQVLSTPAFAEKIKAALPVLVTLNEVPAPLRALALAAELPEARQGTGPKPRF